MFTNLFGGMNNLMRIVAKDLSRSGQYAGRTADAGPKRAIARLSKTARFSLLKGTIIFLYSHRARYGSEIRD
jgi:hypothetical protein